MAEVLGQLFKAKEEEKYRALQDFYVNKNINFKTDLGEGEIQAIAVLEWLDEYARREWGIKLDFKYLTRLVKELRVSRNRLGRKEAVTVLKEAYIPEEKEKSTLSKVLSLIISVCGVLGSGKTLLITLFGKIFAEKGYTVYSNYKTSFSRMVNPNDLFSFKLDKCVLLLDEAETVLDSRVNRESNRLLTYFVLQSRKRNVHIFLTTQLFGAVDKRLRYVTDYVILAERIGDSFVYTLFYRGLPISMLELPYEKASAFFDIYDSYEIVYPLELMGDKAIDFSGLKEIFASVPTKKSFTTLVKKCIRFWVLKS